MIKIFIQLQNENLKKKKTKKTPFTCLNNYSYTSDVFLNQNKNLFTRLL